MKKEQIAVYHSFSSQLSTNTSSVDEKEGDNDMSNETKDNIHHQFFTECAKFICQWLYSVEKYGLQITDHQPQNYNISSSNETLPNDTEICHGATTRKGSHEPLSRRSSHYDVPIICDPFSKEFETFDLIKKEVLGEENQNVEQHMNVHSCTVLHEDSGVDFTGFIRNGLRQGKGVLNMTMIKNRVLRNKRVVPCCIEGMYTNNKLEGEGNVWIEENTFWRNTPSLLLHGRFVNGALSGFVYGHTHFQKLAFVGNFIHGVAQGKCWLAQSDCDGWLYGSVDSFGKFTSTQCAFIYPNFFNSMYGEFRDGTMVEAYHRTIVGFEINEETDVLQLALSHVKSVNEETADNSNGVDFDCLVCSNNFGCANSYYSKCVQDPLEILCNHHLQDCYESTVVECKESTIANGGEGLFARTNIPKDTIVTFYNGIFRLSNGDYGTEENGYSPVGDQCYQIYVDFRDTSFESPYMDIPLNCRKKREYCASLGHKVNHSFRFNCKFDVVVHPRFGRIPAVRSCQDIKAGQELFVHYKYDMQTAPEWYLASWSSD